MPRKSKEFGVDGTAFARTTGMKRHVTVYPGLRGNGTDLDVFHPSADFTLPEGDVLLKTKCWERTTEWTELEPQVFVSRVKKL